jgi:hypothetical protein
MSRPNTAVAKPAKMWEEDPSARAIDNEWTGMKLTGVGVVTLLVSIAIIVFCATRFHGCMASAWPSDGDQTTNGFP